MKRLGFIIIAVLLLTLLVSCAQSTDNTFDAGFYNYSNVYISENITILYFDSDVSVAHINSTIRNQIVSDGRTVLSIAPIYYPSTTENRIECVYIFFGE